MSTAPSIAPLSLSPQDRARVEQVEALARSGREGLPALLPLLDDPSWAVRRAVVAALARLGDDALGPLCGILRSQRNSETRLAAAVDAIAASSGHVLPAMAELSRAADHPAVICDALQVLGRRKERDGLKYIVPLAGTPTTTSPWPPSRPWGASAASRRSNPCSRPFEARTSSGPSRPSTPSGERGIRDRSSR